MKARRLAGVLAAAVVTAGASVAVAAPMASAPRPQDQAPRPVDQPDVPRQQVSRGLHAASRKPVTAASSSVVGIASPCPARHPYPTGAAPTEVARQLSRTFGIRLAGAAWTTPQNAPLVRIVWQTLDGISCTSYLSVIRAANPDFTLNAAPIRGYAWGDWGLTRAGAVTLDLGKWRTAHQAHDDGRLVRLLVHELGHAWSKSPAGQTTYQRFEARYASTGNFGSYAHSSNETFSEIVGYYVARCAKGNPYTGAQTGKRFAGYYDLVRTGVFGGRQFGPAPGTPVECSGS